MKRRLLLAAAAGAPIVLQLRPAQATPEALAAAIHSFTGGTPLREGKVRIEVATLVDNGNTVPVSVSVPGAAPAEVAAIALFNERNPQSDVARFHFGPRAGERAVSTRIRLATSQQLVAVARLADGSCWSHRVEVVVTLAACIE
jgi:sulfur-oxidizing protein SoxY